MNNPQDSNDDLKPLSRRAFVKTGVAAVGAVYAAALGYPVYQYLATAAHRTDAEAAVKEVVLDGAEKLPKESAMIFKFGGRPALLIHHGDDSWTALSAVCTHLGCTVQFDPAKTRIFCACHGGIYDSKTGSNVSGPPPKPLAMFQVQVGEGKVVVSRA